MYSKVKPNDFLLKLSLTKEEFMVVYGCLLIEQETNCSIITDVFKSLMRKFQEAAKNENETM